MGQKESKGGKYGKLPDTVPIDKLHKFTHFSQEQIFDLLERFRHIAIDRSASLDPVQQEDEHAGLTEGELEALASGGSEPGKGLDMKAFGGLTYDDFRGLFQLQDSQVAQQCFTLFDSNGDGLVDFKDFVVGMSMCYSGSIEEKLSFCFQIWDTKRLGYINKEEMRTLIRYLVRMGDILILDEESGQRVSLELERGRDTLVVKPKEKEGEKEKEKEKEKGREEEREEEEERVKSPREEDRMRKEDREEEAEERKGRPESTRRREKEDDAHHHHHHHHHSSGGLSASSSVRRHHKEEKAEEGKLTSSSATLHRRHHHDDKGKEGKEKEDEARKLSSSNALHRRAQEEDRDDKEERGRLVQSSAVSRRHHHDDKDKEKDAEHEPRKLSVTTASITRPREDKEEEKEHVSPTRLKDKERDERHAASPHSRRKHDEKEDKEEKEDRRPSRAPSQPGTPSDSPRSRHTDDSTSSESSEDEGSRPATPSERRPPQRKDAPKRTARSRAHSRERRRHNKERDLTRSGEIPRVSRSHQDLLELERKPSEASLTGREKSDSAKKRRQEKERKDERVSAPQSPMSLSTPNPPFAAGTRSPSQAQLGALSRNGSSASLSGDLPVLHHAGYGSNKIRDSPLWQRKPDELRSSVDDKIVIKTHRGDLDSQVDRFVEEIFLEADCAETGQLTFEQFKKWASKTPLVTRFLAHFDVMLIDQAEEKEEEAYEQEERRRLDVSWHAPKVDPALVNGMKLEEFRWLRKLGQGSYGDVWLVGYKDTPLLFAIKCIKKRRLVNESMLAQARAEKKVLLKNTHPFIVHLYRTFRDDAHVYLLFEYVSGGELDHYFRANNRCFDLATTKFYASELVLALEYLHDSLGAAHRDIKLNNIMVTSEGHLRLADFGFARALEQNELAYTLVGTPEYLPPEVLRGKGYTSACDWWSLGITIFKMLNGHGPFFRGTRAEIFAAIVEGRFEFPPHFDHATRDLLRGLLCPNEKKRLGAHKGASAIKIHPFFRDIDWESLQRELVMPPFVPDAIESLYEQREVRDPPEDVPESYKKLFTDF